MNEFFDDGDCFEDDVEDDRPGLFDDAYSNRLRLDIAGDFGKPGTAVFWLDGFKPERITLPPKLWGVLAILATAKIDADEPLDAFFSSSRLALQMEKHGLIEVGTGQDATRLVNRLRKRLDRTKTRRRLKEHEQDGEKSSLGFRIVRRENTLGYVLGLASANVSLRLLQHDPNAES